MRRERFSKTEFVTRMRAQRVSRHQLVSDLFRQRRIKAAPNITRCQFLVLSLVVRSEFGALELQIGMFGVGLRVHGHIFSRGHGHGTRDQAGNPGDQDTPVRPVRGSDARYQARG
jgi:hypothetical protein